MGKVAVDFFLTERYLLINSHSCSFVQVSLDKHYKQLK